MTPILGVMLVIVITSVVKWRKSFDQTKVGTTSHINRKTLRALR
jgi:hypothetical protein